MPSSPLTSVCFGKMLLPTFLFSMIIPFFIFAEDNPLGPPGENNPFAPLLPQKDFMSEEEREKIFRSLKTGDVVFTAVIRDIVSVHVDTMPTVPLMRVLFRDMKILFGEEPQAVSFPYLQPPDTLNLDKGMRVLAVLKKPGLLSADYQFLSLTHTQRLNMPVVMETIAYRIRHTPAGDEQGVAGGFWPNLKKMLRMWIFYCFGLVL